MTVRETYQKRLQVDQHALDQELVEQPQHYNDISEQYVLAVSQRDYLKDNIKVIEAKLDRAIREKAVLSGEKVTEATVRGSIDRHKDRQEAYMAFLEASKEADLWQALKESFLQRAHVLRDLCSLYIAGYFSASAIKGTATKEFKESQNNKNRAALAEARRTRN